MGANQIRTSVLGAGQVGSYIQTGGTTNIYGVNSNTDYYVFNLTFPENVFQMTGGTLHIHQTHGKGAIFINSDPANVNVTGGTVICEINNTQDFIITSKAPFWDMILRKTVSNANIHKLDQAVDIGSTDVNLATQPLVILNDFTIENGNSEVFTTNNADVTIGRNFSIFEGATYNYGTNTTTFNGTEDGELYIGHNTDDGYEQYFYNLTVNKTAGKKITVKGDPQKDPAVVSAEWHNRLVHVVNDCYIKSGILDQGIQSIRLFQGVKVDEDGQLATYTAGTTPTTAYVMFRDGDLTVFSQVGAIFGNIKFNSTGTVTFTSDVYIKRIGYYSGLYNIASYNMKVDYLHRKETTINFAKSNGSASKMIYGDANPSDGGISILITGNGTYALPLGTKNGTIRYTYATITVTNFTDDGYITITPVDG